MSWPSSSQRTSVFLLIRRRCYSLLPVFSKHFKCSFISDSKCIYCGFEEWHKTTHCFVRSYYLFKNFLWVQRYCCDSRSYKCTKVTQMVIWDLPGDGGNGGHIPIKTSCTSPQMPPGWFGTAIIKGVPHSSRRNGPARFWFHIGTRFPQ